MSLNRYLVFCAMIAMALTAAATTLAPMDLGQLATAATAVVRARCVSNASRWEGEEIWTFTQFEALETFKGSTPRTFTVRLIGGQVGAIRSIVSGAPRFRPGEEVVLFLEPSSAGGYGVTAWVEGTFRVRYDARGRASVTQDSSNSVVFDPATPTLRAEGIRRMPLDAFRRQIQRLAAARPQAQVSPAKHSPAKETPWRNRGRN